MAKDFGMRLDINKWNVCDVTLSNKTRHWFQVVVLSKLSNWYNLIEYYSML